MQSSTSPAGVGSTSSGARFLFLVGLALLGGAGWARWLGIIGVSFGAIAQMGFLANYPQAYPLWNITILTLQIVVLYALVAKWGEYKRAL